MEGTFLNVMAEFDERTQRRLRTVYEVLAEHGCIGRQSKTLPYHITLGVFGPDAEDALILRLAALAGTPAVDVSLGGIGLFRLDVLFAIPNVTRALLDLRRPFADSSDSRDWAPHVTLLKDRPEVVLRAVPLAAERFSGHSGRIVAVSLYQFRPTRLVERIVLAP
jgi:2'-5' RNA ligase